jgi:hypothetical protein
VNRTELLMQRRQTDALIKGAPVDIELSRKEVQTTAAGGVRKGPSVTMPKQRFRLTAAGRSTPMSSVANEAGQVPLHPYILIGYHDADVQEGDEFEHDGRWFQVRKVEPDRTYELRAGVDYRGASG